MQNTATLNLRPIRAFHDIERSVQHVLVDTVHVFAYDADRKQLDAAEEHAAHDNGCPSRNGLPENEMGAKGVNDDAERQGRNAESRFRHPCQRFVGKAGDAVQREFQHFGKRIAGFAVQPLLTLEQDGRLTETYPGDLSPQELIFFGHPF